MNHLRNLMILWEVLHDLLAGCKAQISLLHMTEIMHNQIHSLHLTEPNNAMILLLSWSFCIHFEYPYIFLVESPNLGHIAKVSASQNSLCCVLYSKTYQACGPEKVMEPYCILPSLCTMPVHYLSEILLISITISVTISLWYK